MCACYAAVATSKTGTHALKEDHGEQSHGTAFQEPAAMTTPALAHHHLPEYDGERDNWRAYVIKAEAYFEATGVTDTARKRALLVAALNTKTVQILAGRVAPKKPNSLTYEEVVATLNEYFDPKRHEITESFRFFNRCQHEAGSPTSLPAADDIANEFQDVFSAELGCISGPPVHLQLKEGATPKFYHQPLLGLLKADKPTPALAAARIQRWALYLGGFRYKLQYSPGSTQETEEWTLPPDTAVYARNYGQGEKWTPGKVQSTTGSRMVTIQTPTGVVRRHIDQVRSRPSPASARSGVRDQDEGSPSAAAAPAPTDNEGDLNEQPTDQVAPAQASPPIQKAQKPPQALRRSTRERKPVQRLQY
ncbi:uncharacterized protein LOC115310936 isoform X1 [Ixodes scapularis]|uniref:uncharacterized protein LOC115310936 isoform X1 n=1 Tax=Ixodes scapularis TaxID=6945 RepID=UPI001A9EE852|nr:uncharacterized protein LOC115310936 isoform X1 [Ixodes scapularis]